MNADSPRLLHEDKVESNENLACTPTPDKNEFKEFAEQSFGEDKKSEDNNSDILKR